MTTLELSPSQVGRWADAVALRPNAADFALPITLTPQLSLWRVIAQGGSLVYEAFDRRAATRVAVKLIARAHDTDTRERVRKQAALHVGLEHPCLVPVLDFAALSDGTPYVISELASGEALGALLRTPALNTALACEIASHVLGALAALHNAGLVHAGLEPGAVLLDSLQEGRRRVRLLPAGFADLVILDAAAVVAGVERDSARLYRAPEQLASGVVNARTDLYAVGVLLHEMLTGVRLHQDVAPQDLAALRMRESLDERFLTRAGVGSTLARFVCTALARDPAERFVSAEEMLCELHAARADESCVWRLPTRQESAVREVTLEAPLTTPVVPLVSVHPKSPLDSAIWRTQETELSLVAVPRRARSGWKPLLVGFCVTMAAGAALLFPFDSAPPGSNASVAPMVRVETHAPVTPPTRKLEAPPSPRAADPLPRQVPPAPAATPAVRAEHAERPAFKPAQAAPVGARTSAKPRIRPESSPHHRRGASEPRELPANPY
jgi:eukaryotic-like serine/threonine-protein kinase